MRFLFVIGVIAVLIGPARATESDGSMESFLDLVQQRNPDLRAMRASLDALRARRKSARVWDNPILGYSKEDEPGGGEVTHWRGEQDIPFPGKRTLEGDMAAYEAEAMEAETLAKSLAVRAQARSLLFRFSRTQKMSRLLSEQIALVDTLTGSVRGRIARVQGGGSSTGSMNPPGMAGSPAGDGGSAYFALESERTRLANVLLQENLENRSTVRELNALLDRPVLTPLETVLVPSLHLPNETADELVQRSVQSGPARLRALKDQRAAQARLSRARLEFAPDFSVMYDWMKDKEGMTGSEKGISASLPLWWNRPRGELAQARAALVSVDHSARAVNRDAERAVWTRYDEVETGFKVLRNIETGLLPSARSAFNIERARFESGRGEVTLFLETFRGVLMAEMDRQRAIEEFAARWGALEQAVGGPVILKEK